MERLQVKATFKIESQELRSVGVDRQQTKNQPDVRHHQVSILPETGNKPS